MPTHIEEFVAIDPLALFFRGRVLQILLEMKWESTGKSDSRRTDGSFEQSKDSGSLCKKRRRSSVEYATGEKAVA
jgi:hypothetical protein